MATPPLIQYAMDVCGLEFGLFWVVAKKRRDDFIHPTSLRGEWLRGSEEAALRWDGPLGILVQEC